MQKSLINTCFFLPILFVNPLIAKPLNNQDLCKLFKLTNLTCETSDLEKVKQTQKHWLRPSSQERWEIAESFSDKRTEILAVLKNLGYVDSVHPRKKKYDTVLVLGALSSTMKKRLKFLIEEWERGLNVKEIVFLVSERPRNLNVESDIFEQSPYLNPPKNFKKPTVQAKTEKEIAQMIYANFQIPEKFRDIPIKFISAHMKAGGKRPTTIDTVHEFLKQHPIEKNTDILAISDQPYILYQDAVLRTVFIKEKNIRTFETVGYAANQDTRISVYLDSVARTLYAELK